MKAKKRVVLSFTVLVVFLLATILAYYYWSWHKNYRDRVYPGAKIGHLNLGGLTYNEALSLINSQADKIINDGLKFQYRQKIIETVPTVSSFGSDLSFPVIIYDSEATAKKIYGNARQRNFGWYLFNQIFNRSGRKFSAIYSLNEERLRAILEESFPELTIAPANAYFSWEKDGLIKINPETPGKEINYEDVISKLRLNLDYLNNPLIALETRSQYPKITSNDMEKLKLRAENFIGETALTLKYEADLNSTSSLTFWTIEQKKLFAWLSADKNGHETTLTLDSDKIQNYLNETVAPKINQEAIAPRFMIQNGKVVSWQVGVNGLQVDAKITADNIIRNFLSGQKETAITTKEVLSENFADNAFNIKELLGTGQSRFTGSPANRRHNIKIGANAVNGLLIKPNEEFSLVKTLGNVDASSGYLQELVIKGNKTIPEYGGGLCQIGTTIFRAALSSGLPITARQNHSYRVSYYEPAGMDAAVYIPQPDVRFINDTGNYILIQAHIVKDDLYFDFWGTKDGRTATTTAPIIYNIVKPEPTKTLVSTDLKPGEKKCTESSHNGADTYFDYTVVYPEDATTTPTQTRRFKSHYVPWQAVCLIGATSTASTTIDIPTSTSQTINSSSSNQKAAE